VLVEKIQLAKVGAFLLKRSVVLSASAHNCNYTTLWNLQVLFQQVTTGWRCQKCHWPERLMHSRNRRQYQSNFSCVKEVKSIRDMEKQRGGGEGGECTS